MTIFSRILAKILDLIRSWKYSPEKIFLRKKTISRTWRTRTRSLTGYLRKRSLNSPLEGNHLSNLSYKRLPFRLTLTTKNKTRNLKKKGVLVSARTRTVFGCTAPVLKNWGIAGKAVSVTTV